MTIAFEVVSPPVVSTTTLIEFILDETGSMEICRDQTISGFNEFVHSQRKQPGDCFLTLTKFDSTGLRNVCTDQPLSLVNDLTRETYSPNLMTNLYDAIGLRIGNLSSRVSSYSPETKPHVLVVIMTDGVDNTSREFNAKSIKELIASKEAEGWTFVFLGANQDAWAVGNTFGMSKGNTMTYDTNNVVGAMADLSAATTTYRSTRSLGSASGQGFFDSISTGTTK